MTKHSMTSSNANQIPQSCGSCALSSQMPRPRLFNSTSNVVEENIKALCAVHSNLRYLDGFPKVRDRDDANASANCGAAIKWHLKI